MQTLDTQDEQRSRSADDPSVAIAESIMLAAERGSDDPRDIVMRGVLRAWLMSEGRTRDMLWFCVDAMQKVCDVRTRPPRARP